MSSASFTGVLYAEDDENDAFFMRRAFGKLRHPPALRIVPDGRKAVDYLSGVGNFADRAAHPLPQLLLLDIKMPYLTGREVLTWVRQQPAFAQLPVVMLTSSTQTGDIEYCRKAGANAFLVKPSQAERLSELAQSIATLCETVRMPPGVDGILSISGNQFAV